MAVVVVRATLLALVRAYNVCEKRVRVVCVLSFKLPKFYNEEREEVGENVDRDARVLLRCP